MRVGIRQLKDGEFSRAVRRAIEGEEVVITDHGRPVAMIVPIAKPNIPESLLRLAETGHIELRRPHLPESRPVALSGKGKSAVDYVSEQRR